MRPIELEIEVNGAPDGLKETLERTLECCREVEGVAPVAISGRIVDDETIRQINREYRSIDSATDVLSFPAVSYPKGKTAKDCERRLRREFDPEIGMPMIGDFVISLERAKKQAEEYGHDLKRELCYLTAHSIFHLFGYDHMESDDKRVMRDREKHAMELMGMGDD